MMLLTLCLILARPADTTVSEQISKMRSDFAAVEKSFYEELQAAKRDMSKVQKANQDYNVKWKKAAEDVAALVKAHPDDPAALDGIILMTGDMRWTLDPELTAIALKNRDDKRMGTLCFNLTYRGEEPWALAIVKTVAESDPIREVKAQANFCRGCQSYGAAFPWGRTVPKESREPLIEKARAYFTEAATFTDVKTPEGKGTIASKAVNELHRLDNLSNLKVGGVAPEITGTDLDGKPLKLSDYRGKVVVVVFWGSWCGPCMAMVPHEKELWERHKDNPFALFGVNCGDTREVAKKTATDKGMAWPSWYSGEETRGDIAIEYDVQQWPTVFVIDAKGVIRFIDVREKELEKAVESLLAEMK
jgi:thiol-disulfide isomerase/thioredoxin